MSIIDKFKDMFRSANQCDEQLVAHWLMTNVDDTAATIQDYFAKFKFVLRLDHRKILDTREPFAYVAVDDIKQYCYPARPLDECALWTIATTVTDSKGQWHYDLDHTVHLNSDIYAFFATNNSADAVMVALKYGV